MDHYPQPADSDLDAAWLDDAWREHRRPLVNLSFRMVGNIGDAEDIVQETFARLSRVDLETIPDLPRWLVVVASRLCLDHLRSARSRHEIPVDEPPSEAMWQKQTMPDPADRVTLDDSVRLALLVVLERLTPAERVVFVLHDVFQFSFDAIADIVGRSPAACRQLASRARRRVETETGSGRFEVDLAEQHRVAERFIAACAGGDLEALVELLDPDVVGVAVRGGIIPSRPIYGRLRIARRLLRLFGGDPRITLVSMPVDGDPGVIAFRDRRVVGVLSLSVQNGRVNHIHALADRRKLSALSPVFSPPR